MILVRRTYIPKAGAGGNLISLVKQAGVAIEKAGLPKLIISRAWHGKHGSIYTDQQWGSLSDYEESRKIVRNTKSITAIFKQIYPLLAETHDTQILSNYE